MTKVELATRLRVRAAQLRMTAKQIAYRTGGKLPPRTVSNYLTGASEPKALALTYLAHALETTPNALLGWEEQK